MRKIIFYVIVILSLLLFSMHAFSQDNTPTPVNIFEIIKKDSSNSLWTLKKTNLFRINLVKMEGEGKLHKHPDAEHTIFVVKGVIHAVVNGQALILRKGDLLSIPAGVPHKYTIKGRRAIIMSMDAPYYDPNKTIMLE